MLVVFAVAAMASAFQSDAFRTVQPGFNDPKTVVDRRMRSLPASLKLTSSQKQKLRREYLELAVSERTIIDSPGPKILKRAEIGRRSTECDAKIRAILSKVQYHLLKQWEASQHLPRKR